MRIGIDARLYGERGLGRYISELLLHVEEIDQTNEYVIVMRRSSPPARGGARGGGSERFKVVTAHSRWYSVAEQWEIPRIFSREKCDLVHIPHMNVPIRLQQPFVITIHDLILQDFPDARGSRLPTPIFNLKYQIYQRIISRAVKYAAHIITPSQYMKDRICSEFDRDAKNVTVTYEGVSASLGDGQNHRVMDGRAPYFLVIGSAYPHKNLEAVIDAFRDLQRTVLCNTTEDRSLLLVVGKNDYFMRRLQREKSGGEGVKYIGEVSDLELSSLYKNARALIFASCEEGFGLPGLEALQYGTPVISGDRASLPEVYGTQAMYVNPYDKEDIRRAMEYSGLTTVSGQTTIRTGWRDLAEKTLEVYTEIASPAMAGSQ